MGMSYSMSFENALIKPENYHKIIGWTPQEVAAESRADHAAGLALDAVNDHFRYGSNKAYLTDDGIDLSGCGYWDSAGYGYGDELIELLRLCEPGAVLESVDVEESTGATVRYTVLSDRTIKAVEPDVIWMDPEGPSLQSLIADARTALLFDTPTPAVVDALAGTLEALVSALEGKVPA